MPATITLHGHTPSGLIQWHSFTPKGATVILSTRTLGVHLVSEAEVPVEQARRFYREQMGRGCFKRVS